MLGPIAISDFSDMGRGRGKLTDNHLNLCRNEQPLRHGEITVATYPCCCIVSSTLSSCLNGGFKKLCDPDIYSGHVQI